LINAPDRRALRRFGLLGHAASIGRELCRFNRAVEPRPFGELIELRARAA
jgi:hypothetical protein